MAKDAFIENVIEWLKNDNRATLSLSQRRTISKIEKLANEYPDECKITARNTDGTICAHVPVSWIKISPKRKVSEQQRVAASERMSKIKAQL
mgnify:CR=1 FL=1